MKIANDLRLLSSGPRTGLNEIVLPDLQPGSSIMPGKVNPVIPEAVNMVAAQVIGLDAAIAVSAMNGSLELNVMMPLIASALFESIEILGSACAVFADECVRGMHRQSRPLRGVRRALGVRWSLPWRRSSATTRRRRSSRMR